MDQAGHDGGVGYVEHRPRAKRPHPVGDVAQPDAVNQVAEGPAQLQAQTQPEQSRWGTAGFGIAGQGRRRQRRTPESGGALWPWKSPKMLPVLKVWVMRRKPWAGEGLVEKQELAHKVLGELVSEENEDGPAESAGSPR